MSDFEDWRSRNTDEKGKSNGTEPMSIEAFFEFYVMGLPTDEDGSPMLMFCDQLGNVIICVMADVPPIEDGGIQRMIRMLVADLTKKHGPAAWVAMGSEGVGKAFDKKDDMKDEVPGSLQQAHASGDPGTYEVVIVNVVTPETVEAATRMFERRDGEIVYLQELQVMEEGTATGGVIDALQTAFA